MVCEQEIGVDMEFISMLYKLTIIIIGGVFLWVVI